MITITDPEEGHRLYQEVVKNCPNLFRSAAGAEYITDPEEISRFEAETGERIGVLYKMRDYEMFVVDLVRKKGELAVHGRIILPLGGVIIVPRVGEKFVLEDQYRYPVAGYHLAFPRGHREIGSTPEEDAIREIAEECGGAKLSGLELLGKTYPETHSDAWYCSVFTGELEGLTAGEQDGYEGIEGLVLYSAEEIDALIADGKIDCGYTLAAWALYKAYLKKQV